MRRASWERRGKDYKGKSNCNNKEGKEKCKRSLRRQRTRYYLLERYPAARNNDFYLQLLWLKQFGGIVELPWIDWEKIKANSGKLESVRRVRQKIQNEMGLFQPTDPVIKARREKQRKMRREVMQL